MEGFACSSLQKESKTTFLEEGSTGGAYKDLRYNQELAGSYTCLFASMPSVPIGKHVQSQPLWCACYLDSKDEER